VSVTDTDIDMTDLFCGGGGSSQGAHMVPGVKVRMAANHWRLAVETHNHNMPDADHDCADISQVDPRRYPKTTLLWGSPECTQQTGASGRKRPTAAEYNEDGSPLTLDAAERSRATMWDIVRFTEYHRYEGIIVENVVEAAMWIPFQAWLMAMDSLGYDHHIVYLNSAHAHGAGEGAAQLRDRIYICFWKKGNKRPDFEKWTSPWCYCESCGDNVRGVQTWKKPGVRWGRYKRQYTFTCPTHATTVHPIMKPAMSIVDWSIPAQRIGDRKTPLAAKTMARIQGGLEKHRGELLAVPVEGRDGKIAWPMSGPLRTQTARNETGILFPQPFIAELRGGGSKTRAITDPLATVTASGNHHGLVIPSGSFLMRNNGSKGNGAEHCTSLLEPARTITTAAHQSLVLADQDVMDCLFRMLEPIEAQRAMAFPEHHVMLGTKRERVRMAGNAVTPPTSRDLISAYSEVLNAIVIDEFTLDDWERELLGLSAVA
jgi:DNA (cytosine-5)-methyltransferase 1